MLLLAHMLRTSRVLSVLLIVGTTAACGPSDPAPRAAGATRPVPYADTVTVDHVLRSDARFSQFAAALDSTGLRARLRGPGPLTVLAVPNAAFNRLSRAQRRAFNDAPATLRLLLERHLLDRDVALPERPALLSAVPDTVGTLGLWPLVVARQGLRIGPARVLDRNVPAANGRIHVVNALLPAPPKGAATRGTQP